METTLFRYRFRLESQEVQVEISAANWFGSRVRPKISMGWAGLVRLGIGPA